MMKKIYVIIIVFMMNSGFCAEFGPWKAGVMTGDDLLQYRHRSVKNNVLPVYNGVQGGAFFLIRFFQKVISPQDGPNCRHEPVCSVYGVEAVIKHGALAGSFLAGDRLLRCNPFYAPSKDPVPEKIFGQ